MRQPERLRRPRVPRGIATLTVVMVLFFIVAMVAAYTNRTLIVDQRSSANNLHAAQALQAADSGIEWALTQLNGPRESATCTSSNQAGDAEFRGRYLILNQDNTWTMQNYQVGGLTYAYAPSCVANAGTWTCSCPTSASPTPSLGLPPNGLGQAFRVIFQVPGSLARPGTIGILSQGCSNLGSGSNTCITQQAQTPQVDAVAQVTASVGLVKALPYVPAAALTAGTTVTAATLTATNADSATGLTVHAGGAITVTTPQFAGPPGSGSDGKLDNDPALAAEAVAGGRLFESFFGMDTANYRRQPAVAIVDCTGGCNSASIADALARYPGRMIWIDGDITFDGPGAIGTAAQPAMIVATGTVTFAAALTYNGLLYANAIVWSAGADTAVVAGALVAATTFTASVAATVSYDATMLATISRSYGSFVRVPGGAQYF